MYVHKIDPVIGQLAGVYLWYYGLSYTLGFLSVHSWFRRNRSRLGISLLEVHDISILLALGILVGGRLVEVAFYEWDYYSQHLTRIAAYWLGGMSTHGILLGATLATWAFCRWSGRSFLAVADELVIPGAFIMGVGRLGNFIDGQIMGAPTDVWWGVVFPDTEGPRHPVVLYDGIKNLLLIPLLLWVRQSRPPSGVVTAHFIFWYGFLRVFVDLFREYRVDFLGLAPGQGFNVGMALAGLALYLWVRRRAGRAARAAPAPRPASRARAGAGLAWRRVVFAVLVLFPLVIPSDWTQDVPARYGGRHPGLSHSALYPRIPERAPGD